MKVLDVGVADAERSFSRELEVFRNEVEAGTQFFFTYLAVHAVAHEKKRVHALLNTAPLFWNTCMGALQTAAFIALGRVFDQTSPHNVDAVLRQAQQNPEIFSKAALGQRKQGTEPKKPDWLDEYMSKAYVPTNDDFRRLRRHVRNWRRIYDNNYADVRNLCFAHKVVLSDAEMARVWGKGNNRELQRMFAFLNSLHDALCELFLNGRKPVLRQVRYSVARMRKLHLTAFTSRAVQEHVTREVDQFLTLHAKRAQR